MGIYICLHHAIVKSINYRSCSLGVNAHNGHSREERRALIAMTCALGKKEEEVEVQRPHNMASKTTAVSMRESPQGPFQPQSGIRIHKDDMDARDKVRRQVKKLSANFKRAQTLASLPESYAVQY